ncbi:HD-GYP domain-containing protein [Paenibacillus sinensis]|uniref:HD-GYP domain-containing protein n=2 Tax=Paenibacillus TaxID=44249 RepID=UPI001F2EA79B|nr:HD-GYP domain-containing protein [Paenibacillus sinensis]
MIKMSYKAYMGKKAKYDIMNRQGVVLVPAHSVLNQDAIKLLELHNVDPIDIVVMSLEEARLESPAILLSDAVGYSQELFSRLRFGRKLPLMEIKNELIPAVKQVSQHPDLFELFESVKAKDEYTHKHNIGVGVLSTLIGQWLKLEEADLSLLSLAATLHDIGKVRIPEEILLKPGKLTKAEFAEMKKHTIYGYEMLKETVGLSPRVMLVALQHHERSDGSGYPLGLKGGEIDYFSEIVAVADVFHAISSERPYHPAMPFYRVVTLMRDGAFGDLNPQLVSLFMNNYIHTLKGRRILLTDGREAEVLHINQREDLRPLIRIDGKLVDLTKERHLNIEKVLG